jgi:hypothetical protein
MRRIGEIMEKELTLTERNDLQYLEQIVEKGLSSFIEVGEALWKIREEKLYRAEFKTFENYCKVRWGISRIHAHRLIDGVEVVKLLPIGNKITTESQARELAKVPTEKREEVLKLAEDENGKITAKSIKKAWEFIQNGEVEDEPEPEPEQQDDHEEVGGEPEDAPVEVVEEEEDETPLPPGHSSWAMSHMEIVIARLEQIPDGDPDFDKAFNTLKKYLKRREIA